MVCSFIEIILPNQTKIYLWQSKRAILPELANLCKLIQCILQQKWTYIEYVEKNILFFTNFSIQSESFIFFLKKSTKTKITERYLQKKTKFWNIR